MGCLIKSAMEYKLVSRHIYIQKANLCWNSSFMVAIPVFLLSFSKVSFKMSVETKRENC